MSDLPQEIEAKFYVQNLPAITARVQQLGGALIQPRTFEINLRFDTAAGELQRTGRVLRLRQDVVTSLTYKSGSQMKEGALARTEIEFTVSDFQAARQFLEALGYQVCFIYEKYRATFALVNVHIMLDELPYGNFVEIEGKTIEAIQIAAEQLALKWECAIPASYHVLFDRLCRKYPAINPAALSFAALQGMNITAADLSIRAADD